MVDVRQGWGELVPPEEGTPLRGTQRSNHSSRFCQPPLSRAKVVGWQLLGIFDLALIDLTNLLAARLTTGSIGGCAGYAEERLNSSFG